MSSPEYHAQYYLTNRERIREQLRDYYLRNRSARIKAASDLKLIKRMAHPAEVGTGQNSAWYRTLKQDPCSYCDADGGEADHIIPRSRGGIDGYTNTTGACRKCNAAKSTKHMLTFLLERAA